MDILLVDIIKVIMFILIKRYLSMVILGIMFLIRTDGYLLDMVPDGFLNMTTENVGGGYFLDMNAGLILFMR